MRRREFVALLGSAATWPVAARAQQGDRARRMAVLMGYTESDAVNQRGLAAFRQGLDGAGWKIGSNLQAEYRWTGADFEHANLLAHQLAALKPELILASTTPVAVALKYETSTIPIVFVQVSDPVGAGLVESLPRPGRNITGFINFEDGMGGKWAELLKEVAPVVTYASIMFNPETAPGGGGYFLPSFEAAARQLGMVPNAVRVHNLSDIESAIAALAAQPTGGLVAMSDSFLAVHFARLNKLVENYKLPAVYGISGRAREGGLISYAPDIPDLYGRAAGYADRILRGESPSNLPVQVPTKFELLINLKTANTLGLTMPPMLLARADEVIE
jgi:putative ABC transport system substrate-binding protein